MVHASSGRASSCPFGPRPVAYTRPAAEPARLSGPLDHIRAIWSGRGPLAELSLHEVALLTVAVLAADNGTGEMGPRTLADLGTRARCRARRSARRGTG